MSDPYPMEGISFSSLYLPRYAAEHKRYLRRIRRRRLRTYLHPLFRETHSPDERFLILSQMRSGSHLVRSLLNLHPDIYCDGELFSNLRTVSPKLLLRNGGRVRPAPVYGFMLKPHNPHHNQGSSTSRWIKWMQDEGFKLIYLYRENMLRQALSGYLALERQIWITRKGDDNGVEPLRVDPSRLEQIRSFIESWMEVEASWVDALPSVSFSYERDLESADRHQSTADAIFDFLGVSSVTVEAQILPVLPPNPSSYVTNWDEVTKIWQEMDPKVTTSGGAIV